MNKKNNRKGFTIVEMLVVVAVMAMITTLATGAVMRSMRTMREKRVDAMVSGLQMALNNYRAQQNEWPFELSDMKRVGNSQTLYKVEGENNQKAFKKMFKSKNNYVDPSAILTRVDGSRMSVRQALEQGKTDLPLGYADPRNTREFKFFTVEYNLATDSVRVAR
ncbi:MAG: type II secretion system protein [Kiritimatiellae bacterium]|nr:type II secretion system protein [Kiritimatiellia bacterium]